MAEVLDLKGGGHLCMTDDEESDVSTFADAVDRYMGDQAALWFRGCCADQDAAIEDAVEEAVANVEEDARCARERAAAAEEQLQLARWAFQKTLSAILELANGMKFYKSLPNGARERLYKIMTICNNER